MRVSLPDGRVYLVTFTTVNEVVVHDPLPSSVKALLNSLTRAERSYIRIRRQPRCVSSITTVCTISTTTQAERIIKNEPRVVWEADEAIAQGRAYFSKTEPHFDRDKAQRLALTDALDGGAASIFQSHDIAAFWRAVSERKRLGKEIQKKRRAAQVAQSQGLPQAASDVSAPASSSHPVAAQHHTNT